MRTPPALRKRTASEPVVTGAGLFVNNEGDSTSQVVFSLAGAYQFHAGDLFTPGTGNWVRDADHDTQLMTMWGHGFLCRPNAFPPYQPPQVFVNLSVPVGAQPGIIVGTFETENLDANG